MKTVLSPEDLQAAAVQLSRSQKGRSTLRHLLDWLNDSGLGLDAQNKDAAMTLLAGARGKFPGTARDAMGDALGVLSEGATSCVR